VVLASSSRSQVAVQTARAAVCLIWERPSVNVRQRPVMNVAIVTRLVTRLASSRPGVGPRLIRGQVSPCLPSMARLSSTVHGLAQSAISVHLSTGTSWPVGVGCGCQRG
jgi:hypothetical protein